VQDGHDAPLTRFLQDTMECQDLHSTPWVGETDSIKGHGTKLASPLEGVWTQRTKYQAPLPKDFPDLLKRALSLPSFVPGVTMSCIVSGPDKLLLVQRSRSEGTMYSGRVRLQHIHSFQPHPKGGLEWKQWTDLVWLQPVSFTHAWIAKFLQRKATEESQLVADDFAACLCEAVATVTSSQTTLLQTTADTANIVTTNATTYSNKEALSDLALEVEEVFV